MKFEVLQDVIDFCKKNNTGVMGAYNGERPVLRPHHFQMFHEGIFYFVLGANRNAVKYLQEHPKMEWMTFAFEEGKGGAIVRIDGEAEFVEDQLIKEMVFNNNYDHLISRFPDGAKSPKFKVYCLKNAKVSAFMPGNPNPVQEFTL